MQSSSPVAKWAKNIGGFWWKFLRGFRAADDEFLEGFFVRSGRRPFVNELGRVGGVLKPRCRLWGDVGTGMKKKLHSSQRILHLLSLIIM